MAQVRFSDLIPLVQQKSMELGLDPALAVAVMVAENTNNGRLDPSSFVSTETVSPRGAFGIFQQKPEIFNELQKQGKLDPSLSLNTIEGQIIGGLTHLKDNLQATRGDVVKALQYWNGGNAALKGIQAPENKRETDGFLAKVGVNYSVNSPATNVGSTAATVLTSLKSFNTSADQSQQLLASILGEREKVSSTLHTAGNAMIAAGGAAIDAKAAGDAHQILQSQRLLEQFGLDQSMLVDRLSRKAAAQATLDQMQPEIQKLQGSDVLDNPLAWFLDQMKLASIAPKYNAAVQAKNIAVQDIVVAQGMLERQKSLEPAITVQQIQDAARAQKELLVAKTRFELSQDDIKSLDIKTRSIAESLSWERERHGATLQTYQLLQQMEQFNYRYIEDAELRTSMEQFNVGMALLGKDPVIDQTIFKSLDLKERAAISRVALSARYGSTFAEAVTTVAKHGNLPRLAETDHGFSVLWNQFRAEAEPVEKQLLQKTPNMAPAAVLEASAAAVGKKWQDELQGRSYDMLPDTNPYKLTDHKSLALNPKLQKNPIAKMVREYEGTLTDKEVLTIALGYSQEGTNLDRSVDAVFEYYSESIEYNAKLKHFGLMGLPIGRVNAEANKSGPAGKMVVEYPVDGKILGFGRGPDIQTLNKASLTEAFTRALITIKARRAYEESANLLEP